MDCHTTPLSQTPDKEGHKMPMLTPKNSDGSQRVIKRIMFIDPKKLRVAGLDLKMAEALKKAKSKVSSPSNSKDTKLALAKSIVSKKIRQAQLSKESKQTKNVTSQELSKSISSQDTTPPKPQIKVANLKTLMPPPPAPVMSQPQTVLLSFLKSNSTSSDSNKRNTPEQIPKASTKKLNAQQKLQPQSKAYASKVLSSEVKFEMKKPKEVESVAPKIIEVKILSPTKETFTAASPHKHRPKVLESKVLSPEEKIDLSTLRVNAPSVLLPLVSSTNLETENNTATSECSAKKTPPMKHPPKEIPPQPVVETAVDFIKNLSYMFEGTSKNDSKCEEDATSFLMSVFEQKLTKVPSNSLAPSNLSGSSPPIAIDAIQSKLPAAEACNDAVSADATSEKYPSFQQPNQQNVEIKTISTVSDPFKEQPPQTVEHLINKHQLVGSSEVIKTDSCAHLVKSSVNQNKETASRTDQMSESSSLIGSKKEKKKSLVEDDPTLSQKDSSPTLPSESFSKDRPPAKETPLPGTSASSSIRKEKEQPPQTIENVINKHLLVGSSEAIDTDSSVHLVQSTVNPSIEMASEKEHVVESISLEKEKKSLVETNLTISHPKDSSPPLLSEIKQSSLKHKPPTEETPSPATSAASTRRKGRKSVPVLIAKLNKNRKTPISAEKLPEQIDGVSKTEEKSSKELEELTELPSEPPPHQQQNRKTPVSAEKLPEQVDGVSKTEEKSSKELEELTELPSEPPPHQQQNRKTSVSAEKLPEQIDGVSKPEEKPSKQLEELTMLPSEPPPHQQQSPLEKKKKREDVISASTPKQTNRRRSTKTLPILIAKLNETRKPPEIKNKPPERVKNPKSPQKVDKSTNPFSVQSEQTEVIQKSLFMTTLSESQQRQTEVCVPEHQGASDDNIKENVDQFSKSVDKSEDKSIEIEMPGSIPKSVSPVKEVLIPKTTSRPASELEKPADEVACVVLPSIKTRKISERSLTAQTASKEDPVIKETVESVDSKVDSNDLQIQTPSQTQDKKEQDVADSKSVSDISHTTTIMDSWCQSQSLNKETVSDVLKQKQLELDKSKEKADVTSRRSSKGKSSAAVKSHIGSTESLPEIEIAETSTRSRRSRARSKTEMATPSTSTSERKQTRQSSEREEKVKTTPGKTRRSATPNTRTISNKLEKTPVKETLCQTNTKESEQLVEPIVNVIKSPTSDHTTKDKGKVETSSDTTNLSVADATIKAANAKNEIPNTPARVSTRKSRSKAKSRAGLSSEEITKITNIVKEELSNQSASTKESNSLETAQTPARQRSQRSTTAKVSKDKLNATSDGALDTMSEDSNRDKAIKVDCLKEKTDPVPTTGKTRRRTKADSNKEHPTASVTISDEALCDPNNVSNPAVSEVAKSISDELGKSRTSRRCKVSDKEVTKCTNSATDETSQTLIDKSNSKETAPDTISPPESLQTQSIISGTRGKRESKVSKDSSTTEIDSQFDNLFHNLESEKDIVSQYKNPSLPTDDSSRISDDSHEFDSCDPDVSSLLAMVTTTDETLKGDACHSTPKKSNTKTVLKNDKPEENEVTAQKEETNFFGFNEKEIEEGQQSTSLRLSQSEEVVSSPHSGGKKKRSPTVKGKKQKIEQTNWKKNSSASLKNWLTTAVKSTERGDEQVQQQSNEMNTSIPLKKRRARDQNLDEPAKLDENVKDGSREDTPSNVGSSTVESNQGKTSSPDDSEPSAKPNPKQSNRKPPSSKKVENEQTDLFKTPNETKRAKRKRSPAAEDTTSAEPEAKRSLLLPEMGQFSSDRRKRGRPAALARGAKPAYTPTIPVSPLKRKYKNDIEFNPRLLLITKKEEIKNDEPLIDPDKQTAPTSSDDLQCALCLGYTPKKKWFQHVSNHYGVGWVVGTEPPLNVNSRSSVLNYMVEFFKNSRVKGLDCRICKRQRRSALGLLTHLEQCCLTQDELKESRVVCEHCHHEYSKSSIVIHMRTCPELLKKTKAEAKVDPKSVNSDGGVDSMLSNTGRLKRKSVIKAENKLKNLDDSEFIPDEVIKRIPPRRPDLYPSTWRLEIEAFGKGFCVEKKCPFTAPTVEELVEHSQMDVCPFMEKVGYKCMKCKFHSVDIEPCRLHVVEKHSPQPARDFECSDDDAQFGSESSSDSISSGVDENDEDGNTEQVEGEQKKHKRKKKMTKKRNRIRTHQSQKDFKKLLPDREFDIAYRVRRWYEKFINDHYSTNPLFDFATPSAIHTDNESFEMYFPKSPISMKFVLRGFEGFVKEFGKSKIAPEKWQTLERFQGKGLANEHAAYFGGPVKSIAWVPLEPHPASKTQYLAIVTRKEIDKFTRFSQPKHSRVLVYIQKYHLEESNVISGEMHYAFPIDAGPAHCLEFLPSGGYAPHMNRLGLVAVGTVATEIKIYSLPLEVQKKECDIFVIIRLEPSFELCLEMADSPSKYTAQYQSQCMSIAWSQTTGHNYVIGGYLNGFVAIWDVTEEDDNLNRFLVNGLRKFVPVTYFWTMDNRIKHVVPHYDVNGLRWLGICNHNRKILLYDLREITKPVLFYAETTKNVCNSLDWPIVWENPSCGHGDAMPSHGKCINTISPMSLVFVNRRFDKFCCGVNDISFNPWRNMYAGAGDNGDINVTPLREAILDVGLRMKIDEKAMSTLDIVSLDGSVVSKKLPDGVGLLEPDYKQKYGLVFGAAKRIVASKNREVYAEKRIPPLNMARLTRINRLRFNPNRSANCLLAIGYENGFVRVIQSDWHRTF